METTRNEQRKEILAKFAEIEQRLTRARLPYEVEIHAPQVVEVSVYEIKIVIEILKGMIRDEDTIQIPLERRSPQVQNFCPHCSHCIN